MAQRIEMEEKLIISHLKGGFGNQLQQYATGLALARKLNAMYKVDISFFEQEQYRKWYKMDKVNVNLELATKEEIERLKNKPNSPLFFMVLNKLGIHSVYRKKTDIIDSFNFKADKRILNLKHSAYISGWCSAGTYVRDIKPVVIEQFTPKSPLSDYAQEYLNKIKAVNAVSIHIRRGDFLDLQHFFRIVPIEYYKMAVAEISKRLVNPKFFIFSNDIEWAKENTEFVNSPVFVDLSSCENYTGYADIEEFELMKHCKHNIIANSSFSWWASYLNKNNDKIVIAPKKWFNDKSFQKSFEKYPLYQKNWIQI